jgi:hypothetical protein
MIFATLYYITLTKDFQQGEIINQLQIVKVQCDTYEPQNYTQIPEGMFFGCNVTIQNPTQHTLTLQSLSTRYFREKIYSAGPNLHLIAEGGYHGEKKTIMPGNNIIYLLMIYMWDIEIPSPASTTPVWYVTLHVKCGFSARILQTTGAQSIQTCADFEKVTATARPSEDEAYSLLFTYPALIMGTWIIGTEITVFTNSLKAEKTGRLLAINFMLLAAFILSLLAFPILPYPPPYRTDGITLPATGGITGLVIIATVFLLLVTVLSITTALTFFLGQRWAKNLAIITIILLILSLVFAIPVVGLFIPNFAGTGAIVLLVSLVTILAVIISILTSAEWKDYIALAIAMLTTTLLPIVIFLLILLVALLIISIV